jgi:hypothetical protein
MKKLTCIVSLLFLLSCNKEVKIDDILTNLKLSKTQVTADGQSTVSISVNVSDNSSADRRSIIFSASSGVFTTSGTGKQIVKAEFDNGLIVAKITFRVPIQPGTIKITAQPEFDSPLNEYVIMDSIIASASVPALIKLEPSANGIASNFLNEIQLTGSLQNANGRYVSKGNKVLFEDLLLSGIPANGRFRNMLNISNDTSKVSGVYSANALPIGTNIKIRTTVLDNAGNSTNIKDSILLTINQ